MIFSKNKFRISVVLMIAGTFLTLSSCSTVEDPEDPGFHKPAVSGVFSGDIKTWEDYGNALEKENQKANRGDVPRWDDGMREGF